MKSCDCNVIEERWLIKTNGLIYIWVSLYVIIIVFTGENARRGGWPLVGRGVEAKAFGFLFLFIRDYSKL